MTDSDTSEEVREYVEANQDLLGRMLAHGDAEARGYALALLANGGTIDDIEQVQCEFNKLRDAEAE